MSAKSFFIALLIVFFIYEILAITIGTIRKRKAKKLENLEKGENDDVSNKI